MPLNIPPIRGIMNASFRMTDVILYDKIYQQCYYWFEQMDFPVYQDELKEQNLNFIRRINKELKEC